MKRKEGNGESMRKQGEGGRLWSEWKWSGAKVKREKTEGSPEESVCEDGENQAYHGEDTGHHGEGIQCLVLLGFWCSGIDILEAGREREREREKHKIGLGAV